MTSHEFLTPGPGSFTVPPGVCQVDLEAYGAEGSPAGFFSPQQYGGKTSGLLDVCPGDVISFIVGGRGLGTTGGINGGGTGGLGDPTQEGSGGGGGGRSEISIAAEIDPIVIAGGGGGRGGGESIDAPGGVGGGVNGADGAPLATMYGGKGALGANGGAAGTGDMIADNGTAGQNAAAGGNGGNGGSDISNRGGGGGGGGYAGGGGGSAGAFSGNDPHFGGGGGGSGFFNAAALVPASGSTIDGVAAGSASNSGNGKIIITEIRGIPGCPCVRADALVTTASGDKVPIPKLANGDLLKDYRGQPVRLESNVRISELQNVFVVFEPNSLGASVPERPLFVRPEHPILYDGFEVPANCLVNGRSVSLKELDSKHAVHTLVTAHRTFVKIDGINVATWSAESWKLNYEHCGLRFTSQ